MECDLSGENCHPIVAVKEDSAVKKDIKKKNKKAKAQCKKEGRKWKECKKDLNVLAQVETLDLEEPVEEWVLPTEEWVEPEEVYVLPTEEWVLPDEEWVEPEEVWEFREMERY